MFGRLLVDEIFNMTDILIKTSSMSDIVKLCSLPWTTQMQKHKPNYLEKLLAKGWEYKMDKMASVSFFCGQFITLSSVSRHYHWEERHYHWEDNIFQSS